jgi:hypothetical protein
MIKNRLVTAGSVLLVLASTAAGCGTSSEGTPNAAMQSASTPERAHAREYAIDHLKTRLSASYRIQPVYRDAEELLTNVRFAEDGGRAESIANAVVVGTIGSVTPGYGFADPANGAKGELMGDGIRVDFDSPDALWRTVHLTVDVDEVVSGDLPDGTDEIRVGLAIGNTNTDEAHIRDGLKAMGRIVWFLRKGSAVFAYDPTLYADVEDGRLIAQLTADDHLVFPMLEKGDPSATALSGAALAELRQAADQPTRTVEVQFSDNGTWTR